MREPLAAAAAKNDSPYQAAAKEHRAATSALDKLRSRRGKPAVSPDDAGGLPPREQVADDERNAGDKLGTQPSADAPPVQPSPRLGVSYDRIVSAFNRPFSMQYSQLADGQSRYIGRQGLLVLEIQGDKADVKSVSLMAGIAKDDVSTSGDALTAIVNLLDGTATDWPDRKQWILDSIDSLAEENARPTHVAGGKRVEMYRIPSLGVVMVTVKAK